MSIICYTGLPGDGKSYSAVENVVIPALQQKRHVAHNLLLNIPALTVVCGYDVEPMLHQIDKDDEPGALIEKCPPGAVIVIDEVWRYWPAGTKANEVPKEELKFFKEHRHRVGEDNLATEILIIDQDPQTGVPAFLRALIELTYIHTKHSKIGAKGRFRVDVYTRAQRADKPSKGALLRSLQGRYKPEVWNCYISHTQSVKLGETGLERSVDDRANLLKGWTVRSTIIAMVLMPFLMWWAISSVLSMVKGGGIDRSKHKPVQSAPITFPQQPPLPPLPLPKPAPVTIQPSSSMLDPSLPVEPPKPKDDEPSTIWRIAGVITKAGGGGVAMLASATGKRRIDLDACKRANKLLDWECKVDGALVTFWSGTNLGGVTNAAVVPGAATSSNALPH